MVDCGDRVGAWRCKCFQAAVLGCCRGFVRRRLKKLFVRLCANDRGSGFGATVVEACNFKAVVEALAQEQKFLWVVEAECYDAPAAGKWRLGLPGARCLGTLLWLRSERHVVKLVGAGALAAVRGAPLCRAGSAPWLLSVAGAPKRGRGRGRAQGFRGGCASAQGAKGLETLGSQSA